MPERFTETMRAANEAGWSHAVQHRFVNELFAGAVPDAVMARYLIQDHRFLDSFLVLLGAALAPAVNSKGAPERFNWFEGAAISVEDLRPPGDDVGETSRQLDLRVVNSHVVAHAAISV